MIFLGITGSFASAVIYDKWQTRRAREKWCKLVSHIAEEPLSTHTLPRRVTIYLAAPPGDGLRAAREHFHAYVKPVLVAAAMDWDVVEGRKEGDVRYKTAERVRRKRRRAGEGEPVPEEEYSVEIVREKAGTQEFDGVGGDLVVGRNVWKEYVRGLHEGWLGPVDAPKVETEVGQAEPAAETKHVPGQPSVGDAAVNAATDLATSSPQEQPTSTDPDSPQSQADEPTPEAEVKKEDEPPKPRQPPPFIQPDTYPSATLTALAPQSLGPSAPVIFPHILGFRNTPIRFYRFLTRRHLADQIGRQVATAVLAAHRPFESAEEVKDVLEREESNWWKTTFRDREPHEESVWIEESVTDSRLVERMRRFELSREDEERAQRIGEGKEGAISRVREEDA